MPCSSSRYFLSLFSAYRPTYSSSNELRYPCPDCGQRFADPAARTHHRKGAHAYVPYHTKRYLAKRAIKEAVKKGGKTWDKGAASVNPHNTQKSSSRAVALSKLLTKAPYHDELWKEIVDLPRGHSAELKDFQDIQISFPVAAAPADGAPNILRPDSDLFSKVGQSWLSTTWTRDGTHFFDSQLPTLSFNNIPSSIPNSFMTEATSSASSSRVPGYPFFAPNLLATPPLELVPDLSWTPSLSPASSTPLSQPEFFTSDSDWGFNSWCQFA